MTTERQIDHVVVAVRDLDRAAATYAELGFTLTPRARHPDRMGTSNRLAQFAGENFVELLEVDRPSLLEPHDLAARPPVFSFGAHNRAWLESRTGMSMLVLATADARAALADLERQGVDCYAPFDFERRATLPDGSAATVAFTLGFATSPVLPDLAFVLCQHRFPQHFWRPAFQEHRNGAQAITAVYLAVAEPAAPLGFLAALTGGVPEAVDGGYRVACGPHHLLVVTPECAAGLSTLPHPAPAFAGIRIAAAAPEPRIVPASEACGLFIEWVRA